MKIEKISCNTNDLLDSNIGKIAEVFPEVVKEGKVDFEALRNELGDCIENENEKYDFTWNGKSKSIRISQEVSTATLRPIKDSHVSKNWKNTNNLYIEGDNLEVLKQLQKTYNNKIKMIYIDPPYNTGHDFIYKDDYNDSKRNYLEINNLNMSSNPNTDGKYHSKWLNLMYPRLLLSKNLLKDDGVIFISIDDNELCNLKKIMDLIYGEDNFIACLPTILNLKGNNDQFGFSGTHEYTIVYARNKQAIESINGLEFDNQDIDDYKYEDTLGKYKKGATLMRTGQDGFRNKRPKGYYPIYVKPDLSELSTFRMTCDDYIVYPITKNGVEMSWRRSPENLEATKNEFIIIKNGDTISFYKKQRLDDDIKKGKKAKTLFYKPEYSSGNGTKEILKLFGKRIFDNPKPVQLIEDFIRIGTNDDSDDIVLDFFSGSATTAQAIFNLNVKTKGNRKFILVQLPEPCSKETEAYKAGYKNICEVGEERIRRSGEQIKEEWEKEHSLDTLFANEETFKTDIGFKVFKLDSSNINEWDSSLELDEKELAERLGEVFKTGRSKDDILYEIMLKYGVFDRQVEEIDVNGKTMYRVGKRYMIVCLEDNINFDDIKSIGELSPKTVIFKESGFADDNVKLNAIYNLEKAGVEDIKCI